MDAEFAYIHQRLAEAAGPEQVFGELKGNKNERLIQGKAIYRRLSKAVHPDLCSEAKAAEAFQLLNSWWEQAKGKVKDGSYGHNGKAKNTTIKTARNEYELGEVLAAGDLADIYEAATAGTKESLAVKVARASGDNDLIVNEAEALSALSERAKGRSAVFARYLPESAERISLYDGRSERAGLVLKRLAGFYSLEQVRQAHPKGIGPRTAAWIWNRLLEVLGFAHRHGCVHGAVLPGHIMVAPDTHGLVLIDWTAAIIGDGHIPYLSPAYETFYPREVLKKSQPRPATDLYLSARSLLYALGSDSTAVADVPGLPKEMAELIVGCLNTEHRKRPQDAWELRDRCDQVYRKIFGGRVFHPFAMP